MMKYILKNDEVIKVADGRELYDSRREPTEFEEQLTKDNEELEAENERLKGYKEAWAWLIELVETPLCGVDVFGEICAIADKCGVEKPEGDDGK